MSTRHGKLSADNTTLSVVVPIEIKEGLKELAAAHDREFSDYVRIVLRDAVKAAKLKQAGGV